VAGFANVDDDDDDDDAREEKVQLLFFLGPGPPLLPPPPPPPPPPPGAGLRPIRSSRPKGRYSPWPLPWPLASRRRRAACWAEPSASRALQLAKPPLTTLTRGKPRFWKRSTSDARCPASSNASASGRPPPLPALARAAATARSRAAADDDKDDDDEEEDAGGASCPEMAALGCEGAAGPMPMRAMWALPFMGSRVATRRSMASGSKGRVSRGAPRGKAVAKRPAVSATEGGRQSTA
jgi:hypothetical protein